MKARLCNKCGKPINYPFYQVAFKEKPKVIKEKRRNWGDQDEWEHTIYPSKPCADICESCWKSFRVKDNLKVFDFTPIEKRITQILMRKKKVNG